ncbi:hypothetical protein HQ585_01585 [candidate division KSB1 bacterium]|nr:hypothetical protein [candidate division KSB1 bacterium]
MKNLMIMLLVVLLSCSVMAQDETLLSGELESGGYGGPLLQVGQINGGTGVFVGGQGGWIINHRFVIGGKGYGLVNNLAIEGTQGIKLDFGCGGALLEYIISSDKLVHFSVHTMIGAGGVRYDVEDYQDDHDDVDYDEDDFFILEPGVNVILNVSTNFRIGAGATYRYVNGVEYDILSDSDLSGLSGQIFLMFGDF